MSWWVYILECVDNSYYTGRTQNIDRRLSEHQRGIGCRYTKNRRPVKLAGCWQMDDESLAYNLEFQIKGWSRSKKQALIQGDYALLQELAKSKQAIDKKEK
jgi:putative endonuclease